MIATIRATGYIISTVLGSVFLIIVVRIAVTTSKALYKTKNPGYISGVLIYKI